VGYGVDGVVTETMDTAAEYERCTTLGLFGGDVVSLSRVWEV